MSLLAIDSDRASKSTRTSRLPLRSARIGGATTGGVRAPNVWAMWLSPFGSCSSCLRSVLICPFNTLEKSDFFSFSEFAIVTREETLEEIKKSQY